MSSDLILGVDPGLKGALALLDIVTGELVDVLDMPLHSIGGKSTLAEYELARALDEHAARIVEAWIEVPTPRPGQGVGAVATSLRNYGILRGIIVANFIPIHDAPPSVWKRVMKVSGDKDEARAIATAMFPREIARFARAKDDGRAEAALIGVYGRRLSDRAPRVAA